MSASAKYTYCIVGGVAVELIVLLIYLVTTFNGCHSGPMPTVFGFVFPYTSIIDPLNAHGGGPEGLITLLQMPLYGLLLAHEWVRNKLPRAVLVLGCLHLTAASIGLLIQH